MKKRELPGQGNSYLKLLPGKKRDEENLRASVLLNFEIAMTGKVAALGDIYDEFSKHVEKLYERCEKEGISIIEAKGQMRGLTQEEILRIIPRKYHFQGPDGRQICDTKHVAARFLTRNTERVTCRLCMKKLQERPTAFERISREEEE